jgi:hypothetical protein
MSWLILSLAMKQLFAIALTAAAVALSTSAARAMPLGSYQTEDSLVVPVADKCGIGRYRDSNGICRRRLISPPMQTPLAP